MFVPLIICLKVLVVLAGIVSLVVHFTHQTAKTRETVRAVRTGLEELYFVLMMVYTAVVLNGKTTLAKEDAILITTFAVVVVYSYTIEIVRGYVRAR